MDNLLVSIIAGLLIIAIFMWSTQSKKKSAKTEETQATPQVEEKSTKVKQPAAEPKKKKGSNKKRRKKKNKKKGKQQQEAKAAPQEAAPQEATQEPEANDSKNKSKQRKQKQSKSTSKKKGSSKPANSGTKQHIPNDGGGWVTAGKKKKKQPRGGYDANAAKGGQSSTYAVLTKKIGIIIGPKGTTLRAIEARSGCKINLPESRTDSRKEVSVTLTGTSQQRQLGKTIIKELVELGFSPKLQPGMKMHTVAVSTSLLPVLRGNKFAALKALEADGNVKISIPEKVSGNSVRVKVAGTTRGIEKTKRNLTQLNLHYHCEATHPGFVHKELYNCNLPMLVGPKGQTIKSIQGDTNAKVYTPNSASANQNVVIVGTKAQVVKALNQVQRVLSVDLKTLTTKAAPPPRLDDDFYIEEDGGEDL